METVLTGTRLGATGATIQEDGSVLSPRIMVTGTITQEITVSTFVNEGADVKALLASLKVGTKVPVFKKGDFWNIARATMSEADILASLAQAPRVKKSKKTGFEIKS